ncbi:hypothetical protein, partial [uncultured Flavobacterium sp.]|uniref:hypothetical protein n=1 Tax=uncultured Flavobacterium sp. TaxID=165435 RepID=UPI0025E7C8B1
MKKTIINIIYKPSLLFLFLLLPALSIAQEDEEDIEFEDDVDDEVVVPINGYLAASLFAGCAI